MRKIKNLKGQEIVYAFAGFLSSLEEPLIVGMNQDARRIADLSEAFGDANGWPEPRVNYSKAVKWPEAEK